MPYIPMERRENIVLRGDFAKNVGELTFIMFNEARIYLEEHGESYQTHAEIKAAFSNAADEWYRTRTAPYEDTKIEANGDI